MLFRNRLSTAWPWLSGVGSRWSSRKIRRRRKGTERSWTLESLEVRTLMSAVATAPLTSATTLPKNGLVGLTPLQIDSLTVAQIQTVKVSQFPLLLPKQIPSLAIAQVKTIINDGLMRAIPAESRAAFTGDQIRAFKIADIGLSLLTDEQINALSVAQIQSLKPKDVAQLLPAQTKSLTTAQWAALVGTVENSGAAANLQIGSLTVGQIRSLPTWQFKSLTAQQVPFLTAPQVASASGSWPFESMSDAASEALTTGQIKSLMVGSTGVDWLSERQQNLLSVVQIQALNYWEFPELSPTQITSLTADQLASIPGQWWFERIPEASRSALTAVQVKALNVAELRLNGLTPTQRGQISVAQIQTLKYWDFDDLSSTQTPSLSPQQMASIPNEWSFGRMSAAARATLKAPQIQGLNVAVVGLSLLTPAQVGFLSADQVRSVGYDDFDSLLPTQTPLLTAIQLQSIPNEWWFGRISPQGRAALTTTQVRSLNVGNIGLSGLTAAQIAVLTPAQVQTLAYDDFRYLPATQTPFLTTDQLASIDNEWWFKQISAPARAALTGVQVQALSITDVGLSGLTRTQIDQLTTDQIHQVDQDDFDFLTPKQSPNLSTDQLAGIDNGWWFSQMPTDARAALTASQISALPIDVVGLRYLTTMQVGYLSLDQLHQVEYDDFDELHGDQIDDLTVTQIASIPNSWYFTNISEEVRANLTVEQIQALNVVEVTINHLAAFQRLSLATAQIQSLDDGWYFHLLTAEQAMLLTPEQMGLIDSAWEFNQISDEARAALSREQLLAMPEEVHAQLLGLDAGMFSPDGHDHTHETPTVPVNDGLPHPDDPAKRDEHLALFALVPREAATFVSIASGNWNDTHTWKNGAIPNGGAQVLVAAGTTVTFDAVQTNAMKWVRIDGELDFATNIDTQMLVETVAVDPAGTLHIGTVANPIASGVAARLVIADAGRAIDTTWDPEQLSRGLISHGTVAMQGEEVTPFVSLAVAPVEGNTQLKLDATPVHWRVGDRLVLTGTSTDLDSKQDEELKIVAINGNTVTIDSDDTKAGVQGLNFDHTPPEGFGLKVYVADMNRNAVVMSQNPAINDRRGHVMFMHSQKVQVHNVGFYGMGRTDKRNPENDPVIQEGKVLKTTGLNVRGRYAVHFHKTGIDRSKVAAEISGSAIVDSPGWGVVNHESYVNMLHNVAFNVVGSSFVTEFGDEIGSMVGNLSIRNVGSGDGLEDRQDIFDFGHGGHGFWLQGPGVEVVDNIATGAAQAAFIFFTTSSEAEFSAANLDDPSLAAGQTSVPVGTVPFKRVSGNTAFASGAGLETWFHLTNMNDGQSFIDQMTTWNTDRGIFTPYTGRTTIRDALVIGRTDGGWLWGTGIDRNNVTNNMTYENAQVVGWEVGISVPVNRSTVIRDGSFRNVRNIEIETAHDTLRTVDIVGDPKFLPATARELGGREQFDIYLDGSIDVRNRDIETYFSPDIVRLGTVRFNNHQIYYVKQAANYVPFPAGSDMTWLPPEIVGKTNTQLWAQYGIAPGGAIAPSDAIPMPHINGLVGSRSAYLPALELRSAKYTNQPAAYHLSYVNPIGDDVTETNTTPLREGWNLLTRQVDNHTRTFFVYGDTKAPVFVLNTTRTDLRVNPLGLKYGIVIYGSVIDDSFGEMHFRKEFKDLESRAIKTDTKGKKYLELDFQIRDLAGNTTSVLLRVMLDSTVPIVPGTGQRDLPPREVPRTLAALLEYYYLTGETTGA